MSMKIRDDSRYALVAVALCNIGIGLVLIGTTGLGHTSTLLRDILGWVLIAHAVPAVLQAIYGRLHRLGEESLLVNIGLIAFAIHQICVTNNPQPTVTMGLVVLVASAGVTTILLWAHLSGVRLGREQRAQRRHARPSPNARGVEST